MARVVPSIFAFNRGIVSKRALARVDVERVRLSSEIQENWIPKTQGSMIFRPGFEYITSSLNDAFALDIPFIASSDDTAILEMTDAKMRGRLASGWVSREAVSTAVQNGDFSSATGWTDDSTTGASTNVTSDPLTLIAEAKGSQAVRYQEVTVASGDQSVEHALEIDVV